jgi:hypothetical protein
MQPEGSVASFLISSLNRDLYRLLPGPDGNKNLVKVKP